MVGVQMEVWGQDRAVSGDGDNECINCLCNSVDGGSSSSILCFVDRAALYNLVNEANSVHSFS